VIVHTAQRFPRYVFFGTVGVVLLLSILIDLSTFRRYPYSFKQVYEQDVIGQIKTGDKIVTVLPSFAEVLYYRNRLGIDNEMIVLTEGLVQFSGKSLLDIYTANGVVKVTDEFDGRYFELRRLDLVGPSVEINRK